MRLLLQLFTSCMTIWCMVVAGKGDQRFNYIGIVNNFFWWIFTVTTPAWGLAPLNAALAFVYVRNLWRWKHGKEIAV